MDHPAPLLGTSDQLGRQPYGINGAVATAQIVDRCRQHGGLSRNLIAIVQEGSRGVGLELDGHTTRDRREIMRIENVEQCVGQFRELVVELVLNPAREKGEGFNQSFNVRVAVSRSDGGEPWPVLYIPAEVKTSAYRKLYTYLY